MNQFFTKIVTTITLSTLVATSANAFDIKLNYTQQPDATWTYVDSGVVNNLYSAEKTNNIGLEIGHYKNTDKQGFGFGWHIGASVPTSFDFEEGGTIELGIAPGYTIIPNLTTKIELGLGSRKGWAVNYDFSGTTSGTEDFLGIYYGLSAEYVIADHLILGIAAKNWSYSAGNGLSSSYLVPEASIGYRF